MNVHYQTGRERDRCSGGCLLGLSCDEFQGLAAVPTEALLLGAGQRRRSKGY